MEDRDRAKGDDPERGEERQPSGSSSSDRAVVILYLLTQVVTVIGPIIDLFR